MGKTFIECNRSAGFLLPPSLEDWLPEGHLGRFVVEITEQLDMNGIYSQYTNNGGHQAYEPRMLLGLLFYGYASGVYSSRKLERATYESVAFRYITANTHPDHDTISNFRKRFLDQIQPLFLQILTIAAGMGVLKVGKVSLDGTKIKANASKHKALSYQYACKLEEQLEKEVKELLRKAEEADREELPDGMEVSEEVGRREERIKKIREAKAEMERRAKERYEEEKKAYDAKIAAREEKAKESGKKPGGKPPQPPEEGPRPNDQVNLTDDESRIMPASGGGFCQGYNAQAVVDNDTMLVLHQHITQSTNDKRELEPVLNGLKALPEELGKVEAASADNGYYSETNVDACEKAGIVPYLSPGREGHNQPWKERFAEPPPLPEDASAVEQMKHRLKTKEGKAFYALRKSTVEPTFGIIKHVMGFRQFLLRGLEKVKGEWNLVCLAYNLKRLHALAW